MKTVTLTRLGGRGHRVGAGVEARSVPGGVAHETVYHRAQVPGVARKIFTRSEQLAQARRGDYNSLMAKKKTESATKSIKESAKPAKQADAKKTPATVKPASAPASAPLIDTSLAANAAAAMIGNKAPAPAVGNSSGQKKESAAFKQLKAGLNKPSAGAMGGAFGAVGQSKKSHQAFGGGKQTGHSQTFGADVSRSGVPRRTPG